MPDRTRLAAAPSMLLVGLAFVLSGAAGLIYQVAWAKYLGYILGGSAQAHAVVLATFLGGLAIGNAVWGAVADRLERPWRTYAGLELGAAIWGGCSPWLLGGVDVLFVRHAGVLPPGSGLEAAAHAVVAALVILPATFLLGGTLPTLAKVLTRALAGLEVSIGRLYFLSSTGAVMGALGAGFALIPWLGLDGAVWTAAGLNAVVGAGALLLGRGQGAESERGRNEADEVMHPTAQRRFVAIAVFVSGFAALALEIGWIRLLSLILGSSAYSFSLMLGAFIGGLAIGAWVVTWPAIRRRNPFTAFCMALMAAGLTAMAMLPLYGRLPYAFTAFGAAFHHHALPFAAFEVGKLAVCFALMAFPTIFLGMTLPLASRVATRHVGEVGRQVGGIFSLNTVGNVGGGTLAGTLLLPLLGVKGLVILGAALLAGTGAIAATLVTRWRMGARVALAVAALATFEALRLTAPAWDPAVMVSGAFRRELPEGHSYEKFVAAERRRATLYYKDDPAMTVSVAWEDDQLSLRSNGKVDATSSSDLLTQVLCGHLPLLLADRPRDVLLIGLGSGITAGSILAHPVRSLQVIELSEAVAESARLFGDFNRQALDDPRLRLRVQDGLRHVRTTDATYDVIISEPTNPWIAGVGNLFTREFFEDAKRRLRPGGMMVQWFHTYEMDDDTLKLALRTFGASFEHATLWQALPYDYLVVGTEEPLALDPGELQARLRLPAVRRDLARVRVEDPATLLSLQMLSSAGFHALYGPGPLNSLRMPRLEYQAPVAFYEGSRANVVAAHDERLQPRRPKDRLYWDRWLSDRETLISPAERDRLRRYHQEQTGQGHVARRLLMAP